MAALDLTHKPENFVNASWSMVGLRDLIFDMLSLLFTELSAHGGMAGDDDAGRAFAAVYRPAVAAVFEQSGFAHQVMANGAGALLQAAEDLLKQDATAGALLGQSPSPGIPAQPTGPDCTPRASHNAEDLPEVVGETSWSDQYLFDRRFHGQRDKLRLVAKTWRSASKILQDAYWESDTAWQSARLGQVGETADAVEAFFMTFVGKNPPPSEVSDTETLMANLPAACTMLANACDVYADHIDTALRKIPQQDDPLFGEPQPIWDRPLFGGEGHDGGLSELVSGDLRIAGLGNIPHALDNAKARIPMPKAKGDGPGFLPPFLLPLVRLPVLVPAGYRPANGPRMQPPPAPPDPRFPPLTGPEQHTYQLWLNSLRTGDVSGGKPAEVAYQKRVAGYPEYEVPIPPGISANSTLMVDGFRDLDGMAVEAKYVNKPNGCYRTLDELRQSHQNGKRDFLYAKDRKELEKYHAALNDPRNTQIRGVDTVTNNQDSVPYWRVMMAAYGVKGNARYVP
ncbi:restriction endonuclease fold toxin-2 domain-containing protein [Streptomyces sp. Edi4]|uniref:restriction endonuclease fold toxin-2 domain-containing protein n=1 Tax=Streptomyces sp. Edi4 TaxID=3162527 RepID=UPI003305777A